MPPVTGRKVSDNGKPQSASSGPISPYWATSDGETVRLYLGEVRDVLARLPTRSVQCVVTSPPYWGLRSFLDDGHEHKGYEIGSEPSPDCGTNGQAQCGECFVCTMVAVFRGVRRVLRDDGVLWLNLGDSYAGSGKSGEQTNAAGAAGFHGGPKHVGKVFGRAPSAGLPSGNLVGVPWRVALALQADGWVLRQDMIWHKPSPMPESVTNRCTKAHEYVFLLTKGEGYYCDMEAIKEPLKSSPEDYAKMLASKERQNSAKKGKALEVGAGSKTDGFNSFISDGKTKTYTPTGSNKRSVWTISSQGYPGAHFATFPPKLVEPCILAGTSEKGACAVCGAPWGRVVEKLGPVGGRQHGRKGGGDNPYNAEDQWGLDEGGAGANCPVKTTGWAPGCRCGSESVRPCVVLDPFIGSGTTVAVANDLGRWGWGIDLSEEYLRDHAIKRAEGALLRRPATSGLTGRVRQAVTGLGRPIHKV